MKKLLVLIFAIFLIPNIADASTFKMSGEYYVIGIWYDNHNGNAATDISYGIYNHALGLNMTWAMTPYTKVFTRMKFRDEVWGIANGATETNAPTESKGNIYVEELWGQHTFMNHTTVKLGLMKTSNWASGFANDPTKEAYRMMVIQPVKIGAFIALTEKNQPYESTTSSVSIVSENGASDIDNDVYVAALITKIGDVNVLPLVRYVDSETKDLQEVDFDIGVNGTINNIGFEAELIFADYNYETSASTPDYSIWAAYANVWTQFDALKLGAYIAHGPFYDDAVAENLTLEDEDADTENDALEDYDRLITDGRLGHNDGHTLTTLAVYATYAINEKTKIGFSGAYTEFNVDNIYSKYDSAAAWRVGAGASYKITPVFVYSATATAQKKYGDDTTYTAIELLHILSFTF